MSLFKAKESKNNSIITPQGKPLVSSNCCSNAKNFICDKLLFGGQCCPANSRFKCRKKSPNEIALERARL